MNKQELIEEVYEETPFHVNTVSRILSAVESKGWLRNPGKPIDAENIRPGDKVRVDFGDGNSQVFVVSGQVVDTGVKYFLLDRPKPELPTEPGSVVRNSAGTFYTLDRNGLWRNGGFLHSPDKFDGIEWEVVC